MKKSVVVSGVLSVLAIIMIAIAMTLQVNKDYGKVNTNKVMAFNEIDVKNMASANRVVSTTPEVKADDIVKEVAMEVAEQAIIPPPPRVEVYDNLTIEELGAKIDRNLKSTIAGKGSLIASYSLQLGVDPYVATAIILHETGCNWKCSNLVVSCNNVGGQKGAPSCNGGSYKSYPTLDEGIIGYLDNLNRNYYSKGLTTVETIGPRYAQSNTWVSKINSYVFKIKAS